MTSGFDRGIARPGRRESLAADVILGRCLLLQDIDGTRRIADEISSAQFCRLRLVWAIQLAILHVILAVLYL